MSDHYAPKMPMGGLMGAGTAISKQMAEVGHVSFGRHDGVGSVSISSPLSAEAAVKLEAFLRELIAEDGPKLRAMAEAEQARSYAAQEKAMRRRYDMAADQSQSSALNWRD